MKNEKTSMKNINIIAKIMAIAPIIKLTVVKWVIIFQAENAFIIEAIPKNNKLTPTIRETNPALNIGKIIKINPNITNIIPAILFNSI